MKNTISILALCVATVAMITLYALYNNTDPLKLTNLLPISNGGTRKTPQPGEYWSMFKSSQGDPWYPSGNDLDHFAVMVLDVRDGWVKYCIGSIGDDERVRLAIFLAIYAPGMANPEDAERERIKYCQRKYAEMQKEQ